MGANVEHGCGRTNLKLLPYNHPLLRDQGETIDFPLSLTDVQLIEDMLYSVEDTQLAAAKAPWPSAAGMAAPQWGASRRIFVIRRQYLETFRDYQKVKPLEGSAHFVVVINPKYEGITDNEFGQVGNEDSPTDNKNKISKNADSNESLDEIEEVEDWEGCFSVPGKNGVVRRYRFIKAKFSSLDGTKHSMVLDGWAARVFQHETDHTDGRLYDDSVANRCIELKTCT